MSKKEHIPKNSSKIDEKKRSIKISEDNEEAVLIDLLNNPIIKEKLEVSIDAMFVKTTQHVSLIENNLDNFRKPWTIKNGLRNNLEIATPWLINHNNFIDPSQKFKTDSGLSPTLFLIDNEIYIADWMTPLGITNGTFGTLGSVLETLSPRASIGIYKNKFFKVKFYRCFNGNKYVSTLSLVKVGKFLGKSTFIVGIIIDSKGVYNYYTYGDENPNRVHPGKAVANLGVGIYGFIAGVPGAIVAAAYFMIDTLHPNGFVGAMDDAGKVIEKNQKVLGPGFMLYGGPNKM